MKLSVYGYKNRMWSSRRLERKARTRRMRTPSHGPQVAHDAQIAVEAQNKRSAAESQSRSTPPPACSGRALRARCTNAPLRAIVRCFHEDAHQAMQGRAKADPNGMKLRMSIAGLGAIKGMMSAPRFLVRGLEKAISELGLAVLGYTLKRSIEIL